MRMTLGEYRVGVTFNPSGNDRVSDIKEITSGLIDEVQDLVHLGGEAGRCAKLAQIRYEEAAMWAVKAITKPVRDEGGS